MKIKKLEWRNIFSYGDDITTIEFDDDGKLWQLSGKSGSGKSSLLSIPKLLLFGKTEGSDGKPVKVADIANRINKKGWIRGTIIKNNDEFVIERTFAPSGLLVYKNGESLDKAGIKNVQGVIDSEILDNMPYNIFANVMTLSLNNFKSFISMTPSDKRLIIDKIFSLEIINKVYEYIKKDMKDLGNAINISKSQIFSLEQTIKTSMDELENINSKANEDFNFQLSEISEKLNIVNNLYKTQNDLYVDYTNKYNDANGVVNQLRLLINTEQNEIRNIEQKLNLFNQDKCPTCGTSFKSSDFDDIRKNLEGLREQHLSVLKEYNGKLVEVNNTMNDIISSINEVRNNINLINDKRNELVAKYKSIEISSNKLNESSSIQKIIDSTNESKANLEKSIKESNSKMKLLNVMESMYSADGIKQIMMSSYIPSLNSEIDDTLKFLGFPYTLEFDNNFDPHLKHLGKDIEPQSLSTGEHKKVDLTVLCSLLKMIKRKYPQINLVCLDETVSSLDYESSTEIIKYLKEISLSMNLNIFIVSHTSLDENLFDEHLYVDKIGGYSVLNKI